MYNCLKVHVWMVLELEAEKENKQQQKNRGKQSSDLMFDIPARLSR